MTLFSTQFFYLLMYYLKKGIMNKAIFFENQFRNWNRYPKFLSESLQEFDCFYLIWIKQDIQKYFKGTYKYKGL